jgi:chromosome segregation ATPase
MKAKTTTQLAELAKKSDAINQLKKELGEKTAAVFALESRDKALRDQLRDSEQEFELKATSLHDAERTLADKEAGLEKLIAELGERSLAADNQRVELAAAQMQIEAMRLNVGDAEILTKQAEDRLARERREAEIVTKELNGARAKLDGLAGRTDELERQLVMQTSEAEVLNRRVQELEARLGEQGRLIAEREYEIDRLRGELDGAHTLHSDLRAELTNAGNRSDSAANQFRSDIGQLEAQLAAALEERARLQREIATMKREAETAWAAERVENALLRERINDVAAEVARLTAVLEGPGSPIDTMLAVEGATHGQGTANGAAATNGEAGDSPRQGKGTLADRIRALQSTASRVASN